MTQASSLTFTVALALTAHQYAETFRKLQANPAKAKQVYLNTLAVYAVREYLDYIEVDTNLEASQGWDPVQQTLVNTAALQITDYGALECRPILPEAIHLQCPAETPQDSIGAIAVQLDESLRSATLLGFVAPIPNQAVPLNQLQDLEQLGTYLKSLSVTPTLPAYETVVTQLQTWWDADTDSGPWKVLSDLMKPFTPRPNYAFDFRESAHPLPDEITDSPVVNRIKQCCLGPAPHTQIFQLQMGIQQVSEEIYNIFAQVTAAEPHRHLPDHLHISVLDQSGTEIMHARSLGTEALQIRFSSVKDERFQLQLTLDNTTITETFIT
ncbi:DUF1822 family protein [Acaryochloris sp. IP29b_bin.148]|uniref:DUF1822 family protein n=1 Tax=Acaryochloris sp. IP29b_bin.148 TaxID=2969218 RepID=UPI0026166A14|nr:DUF1822 family protein [Acaryochloris sp. IP29b_bin.148]